MTVTADGNGRAQLLAAALFVVIVGAPQTESAAVVDNIDKQQALITSEELSQVVSGGCDDGRVANCRTLPLFNYTNLAFPEPDPAGDILQDENCPSKNFERHLRCVDVFTRQCLTTEQRVAFYKLYRVPTLDMQELCTENGPYREEYKQHAACLRTVHSEYVQCGRKHQHELSALILDHERHRNDGGDAGTGASSVTSPEQITQNLVHLCGSFRGHLQCVHGLVRATCGAQTEAFASQFLSQMASSLLDVCEKYGVGGNTAADGGVTQSPTSGSTRTAGAAVLATSAALLAAASRSR